MAVKSQQAIAIFFVTIFIISSCALTIMVVISMFTQDDKKETNMSQQNKLQGTKLANYTPVSGITELQTTDTKPGTGATVQAGDKVTVDYTGAIADTGVIFESSKDSGQPVSFGLGEVIAGWSQGIPGMREGGTRRLIIPAHLAYGSQGNAAIPPNASLVFDVTVIKTGK